jgi:hypothetical protein
VKERFLLPRAYLIGLRLWMVDNYRVGFKKIR